MAKLPEKGQTLWGFTVTERNSISMLGAETAELFHPFSGARLLYIHNDDRELGFNLIYRTPQLDNLDSNHILEHLMLCSCPSYPSRDVFFDMDSKSYSTFMNGLTDNTYTCYPICTLSQEQLIKLVDVYLYERDHGQYLHLLSGLLPEHGAAYKAYGCLFMLYGRTGGFKGSSVLYEGGASV